MIRDDIHIDPTEFSRCIRRISGMGTGFSRKFKKDDGFGQIIQKEPENFLVLILLKRDQYFSERPEEYPDELCVYIIPLMKKHGWKA